MLYLILDIFHATFIYCFTQILAIYPSLLRLRIQRPRHCHSRRGHTNPIRRFRRRFSGQQCSAGSVKLSVHNIYALYLVLISPPRGHNCESMIVLYCGHLNWPMRCSGVTRI
ncbi:hypothetical protein GALMADRAFT_1179270 [Galerina marginata CBS 339.88]|uniref:Uncharacterized protein n=1 Tax=Galerina marginata (strain CBS 339.88) TaxID=685588 RepID=A0A067TJL1_GALM3|nr:hypothetical protein GALMADRAFT_1179270 [Galerina marginata CBS 339.88]